MCSSPVLSRSWSPLRHEYWFGPPNTQCQRYFRGSFTVKCATKVKSVEQVPLVGFTVTETATGGGPVVAAGEVGSVDGLAVGVGAVEVDPRAGPVGAVPPGALAKAPVPPGGAASCGPVLAAGPPPGTSCLGRRVTNRPASATTSARPAARANMRGLRCRGAGPATDDGATGAGSRGAGPVGSSGASSVSSTVAGSVGSSGATGVRLTTVNAPSATASSGWLHAVGAKPNWWYRSVVTNGIRLDPPSSSTSPTCSVGVPVAVSRSAARPTVRASRGSAADSN